MPERSKRINAAKCLIAGLLICLPNLFGCARVPVRTTVLRPAEINMAGYERVTVGEFSGQHGGSLRAQLIEALFNSGKYKVLDRESMREGLREMELAQSGLGKASTEASMAGNVLLASCFITGSILDRHFNEWIEQGTYTDSYGYTHYQYKRHGQANMRASLRVVDLATQKLLAVKTIAAKNSGSLGWYTGTPPHIDSAPHYNHCEQQIIGEFMKSIAPWHEIVHVSLFKCGRLPVVRNGILLFRSGNYAEAAEIFAASLEQAEADPKVKPVELARVIYDLGAANEYLGEFDAAKQCYQRCLTLHPHPEYSKAMTRLNKRIRDYQELQEQGVVDVD